ncbi:MAG: hypothetical protein WBW84_19735 [Acidobacteriaceae bacterium]
MSVNDPGTAANGFVQGIHLIWSTILTGLGGLLFWNFKHTIGRIDTKADQTDFDEHKERVNEQFAKFDKAMERFEDAQQMQHKANTERLDAILLEISKQRRGRST